ncbi:hypothetical protein JW930_03720 [Candidatus Woesearchaeota archaeon]|nr:hypothetical protein [Candidatus Woesearchaeota archaeon]
MFVDICFPEDNEESFIDVAEKLGTKALLFIYNDRKAPKKKFAGNKLTLYRGYILKNKNKFACSKTDLVLSMPSSRKIIEDKSVNMLFDFEVSDNSLNHVFFKLIRNKNKLLGIGISNLLDHEREEEILQNLVQTVKLSRKYNLDMITASFADEPYKLRAQKELESFSICLGLPSSESKMALLRLYTVLNS